LSFIYGEIKMFSELVLATLLSLNAVTDQYGPLIVQTGRFSVESQIVPWSSWWFPLNDDYLFQQRGNEKSTLERYDAYVSLAQRRNSRSVDFERNNFYQPHAVAWAGLCDAWAIASIMEPEPKVPLTAAGVTFRVSDLKALVLKTYEAVDSLHIYGQRYEGKWDSVYEDIYPDQFHRFMQAELFQKKLPFTMDYDGGIEVWNTPVWKAQTDGDFLIKTGIWTNRSRWNHPDYVAPRPDSITRKSFNTALDINVVDKIAKGL
jgi:hypothetical protein